MMTWSLSGAIMISFFFVRSLRNVRSLLESSSRIDVFVFSHICCRNAVWDCVASLSIVEWITRPEKLDFH